MNNIGLYLHIPFCRSKCPYCDFYSFSGKNQQMEEYVSALRGKILSSAEALRSMDTCKADTLYIGGGTPSVLGAESLVSLVNAAKSTILTDGAEITVECNPYGLDYDFFKRLHFCGLNRISLGLQSAADSERRKLGRLSDRYQVEAAVKSAQKAGFNNISLDVMLGIPDQTAESLEETLKFCLSLGVPHISAYILKLEENTHFYKNYNKYNFPDEDLTADLYLQMCETLEQSGIMQYEISNFGKKGFESRHNLKYWHCEEYLGLGPAAHSFIHGRRFYYPRDFEGFLKGNEPIPDGVGGDFTEYAMLSLRLTEGLCENKVRERFSHGIPDKIRKRAYPLSQHGLIICDSRGIRLTRKGFLLSNSVLSTIL